MSKIGRLEVKNIGSQMAALSNRTIQRHITQLYYNVPVQWVKIRKKVYVIAQEKGNRACATSIAHILIHCNLPIIRLINAICLLNRLINALFFPFLAHFDVCTHVSNMKSSTHVCLCLSQYVFERP